MKSILKYAIIAVITLASYSGCKKKEGETPVPVPVVKESIHSSSRISCLDIDGTWSKNNNYGNGQVEN